MEIKHITEDKERFMDLLLLADPEEDMVWKYLGTGDLFALYDGDLKSVAVVLGLNGRECELKNLATYPEAQRKGYAGHLFAFLFDYYKDSYETMFVGTGDSDLILSFYNRHGFEYSHRKENFFVDNYPEPIIDNGVLLVDMVYLKRAL